jgi:hypothetical protein
MLIISASVMWVLILFSRQASIFFPTFSLVSVSTDGLRIFHVLKLNQTIWRFNASLVFMRKCTKRHSANEEISVPLFILQFVNGCDVVVFCYRSVWVSADASAWCCLSSDEAYDPQVLQLVQQCHHENSTKVCSQILTHLR